MATKRQALLQCDKLYYNWPRSDKLYYNWPPRSDKLYNNWPRIEATSFVTAGHEVTSFITAGHEATSFITAGQEATGHRVTNVTNRCNSIAEVCQWYNGDSADKQTNTNVLAVNSQHQ